MFEVTFSEIIGPEAQMPIRHLTASSASAGKLLFYFEARGHRNLFPISFPWENECQEPKLFLKMGLYRIGKAPRSKSFRMPVKCQEVPHHYPSLRRAESEVVSPK